MAKSITAEQIDATCRTCMKQSDPLLLIPIFDASEDADSANDLLNSNPLLKEYFFNKLMIKKEDRLPQALCTECKQIVRLMVKFLNQCDASRTVLDNYLRETYKFEFVPMKIESESSAEEEEEELKFDDIIEEEVEPDPINDCENIEEDLEMKLENVEETIDASYIVEEEYTEYEQLLDDEEQPDPVEQAIEELECDEGTTNDSEPKYNHKRYTCTKCDRDFKQLALYHNHVHTHDYEKVIDAVSEIITNEFGEEVYQCRYCVISFDSSLDLDFHKITAHPKHLPYPCLTCGKSFEDYSRLKSHMRNHNRPCIQCELCDKVVANKDVLRNHMLKLHKTEHNTCPHCSEEFTSKLAYKSHLKSHDPIKKYQCEYCGNSFKNMQMCMIHKRTHTGEKPYLCSVCAFTSATLGSLKAHMRVHHGSNPPRRTDSTEKPYSCDKCDRTYKIRSQLRKHQQVHTREKPHKCDECDREFAYRHTLKRHKAIAHGDSTPAGHEKNYICSMCPKSFLSPMGLDAHKRDHSAERKVGCPQCDRKFKTIKIMRKHLKMVHEKHRPHACDVCGKTFAMASQRNEHVRMHTGERPHVCEHCSKAFRTIIQYREHIRIHTGERPCLCKLCGENFRTNAMVAAHVKEKHMPINEDHNYGQ